MQFKVNAVVEAEDGSYLMREGALPFIPQEGMGVAFVGLSEELLVKHACFVAESNLLFIQGSRSALKKEQLIENGWEPMEG